MRRLGVVLVFVVLSGCGREGVEHLAAPAEPAPTHTPVATEEPTSMPTSMPTPTPTEVPTPTPAPSAVALHRIQRSGFSLEVPTDLKEQQVQGIDSEVGRFESANALLEYDYGWYSGDFSSEDAIRERDSWTYVDGRFAHISYWRTTEDHPFVGAIYVPDTAQSDAQQKTGLTLWMFAEDGYDTVERVVTSIRFKELTAPV